MTNPEELKVGDIVVCVDDLDVKFGKLTREKEYKVTSIHGIYDRKENTEWFQVVSDRGEYWYHGFRFEQKKYYTTDGWATL